MFAGEFYFIDESYAEKYSNGEIMINPKRPYMFAFVQNGLFWFIPITSKVKKFEAIRNHKIIKYKKCDTIDFSYILGHKKAILIQNMVPIRYEYIKERYTDDRNNPIRLLLKDERRIISNAKKILALHRKTPIYIYGNVLEIEKDFNTLPI